ncbi:dipeptidase [Olsenella urininfantis]|uniref:dipeptidase n=1 Tax=Olsenella urininfantis TaxID=1871033 RepID=UPI0009873038|nr:membrane dipeptidase [Olsenella urininfantis]
MRVFDLHCDTIDSLCMADEARFLPYLSERPSGDIRSNNLALATERMSAAAQGGWCQCYAIWVPDDLMGLGLSQRAFYERACAYFKGQMEAHPHDVSQVLSATDIDKALGAGRVAALLAVEGASPVQEDLSYLDRMHEDGVRMVTLCWNGKNSIASGNDTTDGISAFGREAVRHMLELGMVVDVSHLNDQGFSDLLALTDAPFVASHSNSRSVCGHPRNLTDDQFRAIVARGGLVGLNYYRGFITERLGHGHEAVGAQDEVSFDELAAHVEHFLDLGGEDVLALGSDYDGSTVPTWLDGSQTMGGFWQLMRARFGQETCQKIFFDNARRFFGRQLG